MLMFLFLIIILSLEATIGLPIFFFYLSYQLISRRQEKSILFLLFILALALAIFYTVSWPVLALLLLIFHWLCQKMPDKPLLKFLFFVSFNLIFFHLANLHLNAFYFLHCLAFLFYFYRSKLKNYAS